MAISFPATVRTCFNTFRSKDNSRSNLGMATKDDTCVLIRTIGVILKTARFTEVVKFRKCRWPSGIDLSDWRPSELAQDYVHTSPKTWTTRDQKNHHFTIQTTSVNHAAFHNNFVFLLPCVLDSILKDRLSDSS